MAAAPAPPTNVSVGADVYPSPAELIVHVEILPVSSSNVTLNDAGVVPPALTSIEGRFLYPRP